MNVTEFLKGILGPAIPIEAVLKLAPVLMALVPDLLDGGELDADTRIKLQHAIEQALSGELL